MSILFTIQKKGKQNAGAGLGGDTNTTIGTASGTGVNTQTSALQSTNIGVDEIANADKINKANATDGSSQNGKLSVSGTQKDSKIDSINVHTTGEPDKGTFLISVEFRIFS